MNYNVCQGKQQHVEVMVSDTFSNCSSVCQNWVFDHIQGGGKAFLTLFALCTECNIFKDSN